MSRKIDLVGQRFGRLVVVEKAEKKGRMGQSYWKCRCSCGNYTEARNDSLKRKQTRSCGCLHIENAKKQAVNNITHGEAFSGKLTRLYESWSNMWQRCQNPNTKSYKSYGPKRIKVCVEWRSYQSFRFWALCSGYQDSLVIHRIDNDGGYCPENCTWMTNSEHSQLHVKQRREKKKHDEQTSAGQSVPAVY